MSTYPEKTCTIDKLVTNKTMVKLALSGEKTRQGRNGIYAYPGEEFELEGIRFRVTGLRQERLGDLDDAAAQAEGYESLQAYKNLILSMHKGMEWNKNALVWVHRFERLRYK